MKVCWQTLRPLGSNRSGYTDDSQATRSTRNAVPEMRSSAGPPTANFTRAMQLLRYTGVHSQYELNTNPNTPQLRTASERWYSMYMKYVRHPVHPDTIGLCAWLVQVRTNPTMYNPALCKSHSKCSASRGSHPLPPK